MDSLPSLAETAATAPEFEFSPIDGLVDVRVSQMLLALDVRPGTDLFDTLRHALTLAYRQGLRDGVVRLGELVE
ncbi:hypothetical protein DAETH_29150 [Deinococcus aetherius]|uniref:Uncharacterized protein n=1 Tax=Deinococcus aetherius TaxID=200252 RepID=A0ABM8AGL6_9DEIO|nr:hypothetical protein [Deinococcus aetherius]BDP42946.1 hypothetical protein DAETH_29150 [Deinococcus aetherius]